MNLLNSVVSLANERPGCAQVHNMIVNAVLRILVMCPYSYVPYSEPFLVELGFGRWG